MRLLLCFFCFSITVMLKAQKLSFTVVDEANQPLEYASALALNEKDSTMLEFALTDRSGIAHFNSVKGKSFLLQITFLGYETLWKKVSADQENSNLGVLKMEKATNALDVIEVTEYVSPVVFGKDTIQYNAGSFNIKPGDMVEDLLKKLPGVEAERDGTFKAMGEKVQNVMVNGKEFFGKDTRIATKNIDADAVDKVQVFDKGSDRADFTGVDDGVRERSINLKLKKDRSIGSFGNSEGGFGTDHRFKVKTNINKFTEKMRASLIGTANNVNEENFSLNDYMGFMGGIGGIMGGGGPMSLGMMQNMGNISGLGPDQGIKSIYSGGLNLTTDITSKTSLESSFFLNYLDHNLNIQNLRENLTPSLRFTTDSKSEQENNNFSGSYNLRLLSKIDSIKRFTFRSNGTYGSNNSFAQSFSQSFREGVITNQADGSRNVEGYNYTFNLDALYQHKLNNKGRNYSINLVGLLSDQYDDGRVTSLNNIYLPVSVVNSLVQKQTGNNEGFTYRGQFTFTEPLTKKSFLEPKVTLSNNNNRTTTDFFDIINDNPVYNKLLSTLFNRDYMQQNYSLTYLYNLRKFNLNLTGRYQYSILNGTTNLSEKPIRNPFYAFLPSAYMRWELGTSESLTFNYGSNLNEPQLTQLQPAVNNANPLSIYKGNPQLLAETNHRFTAYYSKYEAFNQRMYSAQLGGVYTSDKIINDLTFDQASLVRTTSPVNIPYEWTTNGKLEFETPLKPLRVKLKSNVRGAINQGFASINGLKEDIQRWSYGYTFSLENRNKKVVDLLVGYRYNFSDSRLENTPAQNQTIKDQSLFSEMSITFKEKVVFKSNFDYTAYQPSTESDVTTIPLWTMSVSSFITKDRKLRATLSGFDILNQNIGFITSSQLNFTNTSRFNVLTRYFMLSLSYNLKGHKKSGIEIVNKTF